ncbi:MAG: hypothetical protein LBC81_06075 [Tannerellaceae bacterium]|nr:hypothetical protein [Tannerellaceae bacterium]
MKKNISILSVIIAAACLLFFTIAPHHHHSDGRICIAAEYACSHDCDRNAPPCHSAESRPDDCAGNNGSCGASLDYTDPQTFGAPKCKICPCGNSLHNHFPIVLLSLPAEQSPAIITTNPPCRRQACGYLPTLSAWEGGRVNGLRAPPVC